MGGKSTGWKGKEEIKLGEVGLFLLSSPFALCILLMLNFECDRNLYGWISSLLVD